MAQNPGHDFHHPVPVDAVDELPSQADGLWFAVAGERWQLFAVEVPEETRWLVRNEIGVRRGTILPGDSWQAIDFARDGWRSHHRSLAEALAAVTGSVRTPVGAWH